MADAFTVTEHDEEDGSDRVLGTVTMDGDGRLAIVTQAPDEDERLQTIVDEMNAEDTMHVDAPPPPDAKPFAVYSKIVKRGTAEFVPAMLEHMKTYYDVELQRA